MALANFASLLRASIGLDAASIGVSAIERAVQTRLAACHLQKEEEYWDLVRGSNVELQALIEAVVVPETWFFRDAEALAAAVRFVRDSCLASGKSRVRLMSLPCATGEEPYSLAMALLDAGVPAHQFQIDAVDISEHALEEAQLGLYRRSSFRGDALGYRARHFEVTPEGYRILDRVRGQVRFHHGNLLNPASLPAMGDYDVVFCRNVLIYFDRAAQGRAIDVITRLLTPSGLLFVGPAESGVLLSHGLVSARMPKAHAFHPTRGSDRVEEKAPIARAQPAKPPANKPATVVRKRDPVVARVEQSSPRTNDAITPSQTGADANAGFEGVIQLANENRVAEAAQQCEEHLRRHGPSAQAFYLLGLMRDAAGREGDAAACYRKALYLDPHHHDALVHLALLMEMTNDAPEAHRLRARARRAAQEGSAS
jgi:chemotaxis protein methyltransferase WspC